MRAISEDPLPTRKKKILPWTGILDLVRLIAWKINYTSLQKPTWTNLLLNPVAKDLRNRMLT